jgi:2-methylcitrate dehydratase PrpD
MTSSSLTATFAEAIVTSAPLDDAEAITRARTAIIDWLACAFGGANDRTTNILLDQLAPATGQAVLIGRNRRVDTLTAALINAHAGHVLDYDDVHASVRGHPTTVILPALLALASETTLSAHQLLAGYITGLEAMARLGLALGMKHYETGFHATATLGPIGAAAAVAHVKHFSTEQTAQALGLAATHSSGLRLQFGYDAKPYHAGMAARSALLSAKLVEAGFAGAPDFLDSPIGFLSAFAFGAGQPEKAVENWGAPWQIVSPGLTLKAYPCCTASHPVGALAIELHKEGIRPQTIESVTITFPPGGDAALVVTSPTNGIEARFSAEYVFAAALADDALRIDHFGETPVRDDLMTIAAKVTRRHDEAAPRLSSDLKTRFVELDLNLTDGTTLHRRFDGLPGVTDPGSKFFEATGRNPAVAGIPDLIRRMETEADLRQLVELLGTDISLSSSRTTHE